MAIKTKSIADALRQLAQKLGVHDPAVYKALAKGYAEDARDLIHDRTKSGKGVAEMGGSTQNLKALAPSTIARRERLALHSSTSPATSNLTESGEMLEELVTKTKGGEHIITFSSQRSAKVAGYADAGGRPFLALAASELKTLAAGFKKKFAELVKRRIK